MRSSDGGSAFPREDYQTDRARGQSGMSLRQWYAGHALAGYLAASAHPNQNSIPTPEEAAEQAYKYADAMLAARAPEPGEEGEDG